MWIPILLLIFPLIQAKLPDFQKAEKNLNLTINSIKKSCGQVCDTSDPGVEGVLKYGEQFNQVKKEFICENLFSNENFDKPSEYPRPPRYLPKWLLNEFTHNGKINVEKYYFGHDAGTEFKKTHWTKKYFEEGQKKRKFIGMYIS